MKQVNRRDFLKLSGSSLIGLTLGGVAPRANVQEKVKLMTPWLRRSSTYMNLRSKEKLR